MAAAESALPARASLMRYFMRQSSRIRRRPKSGEAAIISVGVLDFFAGVNVFRAKRRGRRQGKQRRQPSSKKLPHFF